MARTKSLVRYVPLDFSKGIMSEYSQPSDNSVPRIPYGYVNFKDLFYEADGSLVPAYNYHTSSTAIGTGTPKALFVGVNPNIYAISGSGYVYVSSDGGRNWSVVSYTPAFTSYTGDFTSAVWGGTSTLLKQSSYSAYAYKIDTSSISQLYSTDPSKTQGYCICVHEGRILIGGQSDPEGSGGYHTIRYSDPPHDISTFDLDNYVNVGNADEKIARMFDFNGGLVVIKDKSVWVKNYTDPDGMTSEMFDKVNSSIGYLLDAQVFDEHLFILTQMGLFEYVNGQLINLSYPVQKAWGNPSVGHIGWWRWSQWVLVNLGSSSETWIYDYVNRRWFKDSVERKYMTVSHGGRCVWTDSNNYARWWSYEPDFRTVTTTSFIYFPWFDCGNAVTRKKLKGLITDAQTTNDITLTIYARDTRAEAGTQIYSGSLGNDGVTRFNENTRAISWREIAVQLEGLNSSIKSIVLVIEEEVLLG